jgi:hypothetical protein
MSNEWRGAAQVFAGNTKEHFAGIEFDVLVDIFMAGANHAAKAYEEDIDYLVKTIEELELKNLKLRTESIALKNCRKKVD